MPCILANSQENMPSLMHNKNCTHQKPIKNTAHCHELNERKHVIIAKLLFFLRTLHCTLFPLEKEHRVQNI